MRQYWLAVLLLLVGCAPWTRTPVAVSAQGSAPAALASDLPSLQWLPVPAGELRGVASHASNQLLDDAPLATSVAGASWSPGQLVLNPSVADGFAWAVFGLAGLPTDGSIAPQAVAGNSGGPLWVGISDYGSGVWKWLPVASDSQPWSLALATSTQWINTAGYCYVAIVKMGTATSQLTSLSLLTGAPAELVSVRSFMYQLQNLETPAELAALSLSAYDLVVVEPTGTVKGNEAFDMAGMASQLRSSAGTNVDHKIVLAYLNLGQAEDYRTYWQPSWLPPTPGGPGNPDFIVENDPDGWPGNYPVAFWDQRWQDIMVNDASSQLKVLLAAGFDGVYLDWIEGYAEPSIMSAADAAGVDPAREMVKLLQLLRDTAHASNPSFIVIQQGAPFLNWDGGDGAGGYPAVYDAVDGIGLEDTWFGGDSSAAWGDPLGGDTPNTYTGDSSTLALIDALTIYRQGADGTLNTPDDKLVLTIDYCLQSTNASLAYSNSRAQGFIPLVTQISLEHLTTTPPPSF